MILDRKQASRKKILFYGFLFGFGHHVTGLYWISNSLLVEPDKFAWLIPFAVSLIPAYLSIYMALLAYLTWRLEYRGFAKILFFSGMWAMFEILRGHLFTGFPWNLAGYTMLKSLSISQVASVIGAYGMSVLAIFIFASPYYVISSIYRNYKERNDYIRLGYSFALLFPLLLALILISIWGDTRIAKYQNRYEDLNIRIVQPNINQKDKHDYLKRGENLFRYISLSVEESDIENFTPDLIIWPEAAIPNNLEKEDRFVASLQDLIPFGSYLITGSVRRTELEAYNSIQIINSQGRLDDNYYDKVHLVPFGEYLPMRSLLSQIGFKKITQGMGDFGRGDRQKAIDIGDKIANFSPLICYEIIFPGKVREKNSSWDDRSKWILNLTNDGWFGFSSGPYQHLAQTQMRAIEEGVPVVRAANTGVSAIIDSFGKKQSILELNNSGKIDGKLPAALPFETIFAKYGNNISILLAAIFIFSATFLKYTYRYK
jgi:apolipoprotein N-acyltransferase